MITNAVIAPIVAEQSDEAQAALLNGIAFHLRINCETGARYEWQICAISKHLDKDGKAFISALAEFIKIGE